MCRVLKNNIHNLDLHVGLNIALYIPGMYIRKGFDLAMN